MSPPTATGPEGGHVGEDAPDGLLQDPNLGLAQAQAVDVVAGMQQFVEDGLSPLLASQAWDDHDLRLRVADIQPKDVCARVGGLDNLDFRRPYSNESKSSDIGIALRP